MSPFLEERRYLVRSRRISRRVSTGRNQGSVTAGGIGRFAIHPKANGRRRSTRKRRGWMTAFRPPGCLAANVTIRPARPHGKFTQHSKEGLYARAMTLENAPAQISKR